MSIFSSLEYLLTKAIAATNETQPFMNTLLPESKFTNFFPQNRSSENFTLDNYNHLNKFHYLFGQSNFSLEAKINNSVTISTIEKWKSLISSPPSTIDPFLATENTNSSESEVDYISETFLDADNLLENWWNIFDTRYLKHGWGWTITLIMAYMFILVVGVIGNLIVILVILLHPQMRSVTNLFIMNLAVADFFVIVFCVPSTLLVNIFSPWILGSFMCKAVAYVQGVSGCASAYSLAAISLDRCQAIYRNYERPRGFSQRTCMRIVFIIWIAAMTLTIPWAVIFDVTVSEYDGLRYCVETWEVEKHGNIYFLAVNLLCFYAIPLLLIFISNWIIYCHVTHRNVPEDSVASGPIRKMHRETRQHVLKMLSILTLTFLFCWFPVYILVIIIKFSENISEAENNVLEILMPIAQWLGSWNSSINPILYALLNKKFRKMFKSILPTWCPFKAARKHVTSHKSPTFISTSCKGKLGRKNDSNGQIDHHHLSKLGIHNTTNLLISRFHELTGNVVTTTVQITSSTTSGTTSTTTTALNSISL